MKPKLKGLMNMSFMPLLIIYFETVLKASTYETVFNEGYIFMCLFSIPIGVAFYLIFSVFSEKTNKIIFIGIIGFLTVYYGAQITYNKIFSTFASLYFFVGAAKAAQFYEVLLNAVKNNIIPIIFILLPLEIIAIFNKKISIPKISYNYIFKVAICATVMQTAIVLVVISSDSGMLSPSYLYEDVFLIENSIDKFGLLTTSRLDLKNILKNSVAFASESKPIKPMEVVESEDIIVPERPVIEETIIEYNSLDIPFDELIKNEGNENIKYMHQYFKNAKPTNKNKYTAMFEGKNLIMFTAEGFSPYAIDPELTPTLYKMYEEGFKFSEFYTPLWGVSTSDGEYVACTGLLPKEGIWSFYKSSENYMPYTMGNQLKNVGYSTYAYHNHYFDYYFRNISHPNMGYAYKGLGNGLDVTETWPESDVEMIELSVDEYINNQPFHAYYMTVSGHLEYNFAGNFIANKNKSLVDHLNYSDNVKAYLACNIELDRALEQLIKKLDEAGIADDTLIAISPDHYPYGLTKNEISELAKNEVDTDEELYKGVFLLWAKGMEPVEISKISSSLDIIPTLSNLMGIEYDSRLLMGSDILSDSEPLIMFKDRGWITDKAYFNAKEEKVTPRDTNILDSKYIEEIGDKVKQKFKISAMILDYNYYEIISNKK